MLDRKYFIIAAIGAVFLGLVIGVLFFGGITGEVIGEWVNPAGLDSSYVEYEQDKYSMNLYQSEWVEFPLGKISFNSTGEINEDGQTRFSIVFNESESLNNNSKMFSTTLILDKQVFYFQDNFSDPKENIVGIEVLNYSVDGFGENVYLDVFFRDRESENGWTQWFNFKRPNAVGDVSDLLHIQMSFSSQSCTGSYVNSECRVVDGVNSEESGQNVYCGYFYTSCRSDLNSEPCLDYEIRFNCLPKPMKESFCKENFCEFVEGDELKLLRTNSSVRFENVETMSAEMHVTGFPPILVEPGKNYTLGNLFIKMIPEGYNFDYYGKVNTSEGERGTMLFWYSYDDPNAVRESYCEDYRCVLYEGDSAFMGDANHFVRVGNIDFPMSSAFDLIFDGNVTFDGRIFRQFYHEDLVMYINHVNVDHYGNSEKDYIIMSYVTDDSLGYWTPWFNSNTPDEINGDRESRWDLFYNNPDEMCERPNRIECRTVNRTDWKTTGNRVQCFVGDGLTCNNEEGNMCEDYEVRFYCSPPLADGSFCEDGRCYIFEDDNVTIVYDDKIYVVHVDDVVQENYPYSSFKFNSNTVLEAGISESLTYENLNLKVMDILYPPSHDGKDVVIFDYVVLDEIPSSGGSSGGGGGSPSPAPTGETSSETSDEELNVLMSGCEDNICTLYTTERLNIEGHEIYSLMSVPNSEIYMKLDNYVEKFLIYNSVFTHENLTIQILDYRAAGDSLDYVQFAYDVENKNYVKHCDGPRCTIEEGYRLSLGDSGKIVAAGNIRPYISDADVEFYHNGNKHNMDRIPLDRNASEGYSFIYYGLVIKPLYVEVESGEYGGDEFTFIFEDLSVDVPVSNNSICVDDVCRIYVGETVSACGHTFELEGIRINEYMELSILQLDQFLTYESVDNMAFSYENVTVSILGHDSVGDDLGINLDPNSYVELKCSVAENKSYLGFCDYGEECYVNERTRIALGDGNRFIGFDMFGGTRYGEDDTVRTSVFYLGERYEFEFDSRYLIFSSLVMKDLKIQGLRLERDFPQQSTRDATFVFTFEVDENYEWPEEVKEEDEEEILDYDNYVPVSFKGTQEECDGCYDGATCYSIAYRTRNDYCSRSLEMSSQKPEGDYCEYDFECYSNNCELNVCSYNNVFHRIGRWFGWIFG